MTKQEVNDENKDLQLRISEQKVRRTVLVDLIDQMNSDYNISKNYLPVHRYRLLKNLIKRVVNNKWI